MNELRELISRRLNIKRERLKQHEKEKDYISCIKLDAQIIDLEILLTEIYAAKCKNHTDTPIRVDERLPKIGTLLYGSKVIGYNGVEEWFEFPRYKVVGFHMNGRQFFVETLDPNGKYIGLSYLDVDSNQWRPMQPVPKEG